MYARTIDGQTTISTPPALYHDGERWWDLRDATDEQLAQHGWHPVTRTPRPDDTDEQTHDWSVELVDGLPVETWTPRAWTPQEESDRAEDAARLDSIEDRLVRIEAHLWPAPPDPTSTAGVPTMADYGGIWPARGLLLDGGKVWRNITTAPLTTAPSGFPGTTSQWTKLFVEVITDAPEPDPDPEPPTYPQWKGDWSATAAYVVGDHVIRDGVVYRCIKEHGADYQGTWGPPTTGVWVVA